MTVPSILPDRITENMNVEVSLIQGSVVIVVAVVMKKEESIIGSSGLYARILGVGVVWYARGLGFFKNKDVPVFGEVFKEGANGDS